MSDFTPNPDRAATHATNCINSLEELRKLLLQDFDKLDMRVAFVDLAIAHAKSSRYFVNGDCVGMTALQIVPSNVEGSNNG